MKSLSYFFLILILFSNCSKKIQQEQCPEAKINPNKDEIVKDIKLLSKDTITYNTKILRFATIAKVWGLLKYHHTAFRSHQIDADSVLMKSLLPIVNTQHFDEELKKYLIAINQNIGLTKKNNFLLKKNIFLWVQNDVLLSDDTKNELQKIILAKRSIENYYVQQDCDGYLNFNNEKKYEHNTSFNRELRLLTLFRLWNAVYYFYPYHELLDYSWESVLLRQISIFETANEDQNTYQKIVLEAAKLMQDNHSFIFAPLIKGQYRPNYQAKFLNDTLIVLYVNRDENSGLQKGDIIEDFNNIPIKERKTAFVKYICGGRDVTIERDMTEEILSSNQIDNTLSIVRNGKRVEIKTKNYDFFSPTAISTSSYIGELIGNDIAYINMRRVSKSNIEKILPNQKDKKAIIIDLRNAYVIHVKKQFAKLLFSKKQTVEKVNYADIQNIGIKRWTSDCSDCHLGEENPDYYKGQILVLIDEGTQSASELLVKTLKLAYNTILIGSPTTGADGDVTEIPLLNNLNFSFACKGTYFADGTSYQRVGIKPDKLVVPTIKGLQQGRDEVLEYALSIIKK